MKRIIALLLVMFMVVSFAACNLNESHASFTKRTLSECGFTVESYLGHSGDKEFYVIHDNSTNVKYIFIDDYTGTALCPYYDENGNVDIYDGD